MNDLNVHLISGRPFGKEMMEIREELDIGDVLCQYRGAPYKAEILEVHGMQTMHYCYKYHFYYARQKANAW